MTGFKLIVCSFQRLFTSGWWTR